jgi:hypothetical protein
MPRLIYIYIYIYIFIYIYAVPRHRSEACALRPCRLRAVRAVSGATPTCLSRSASCPHRSASAQCAVPILSTSSLKRTAQRQRFGPHPECRAGAARHPRRCALRACRHRAPCRVDASTQCAVPHCAVPASARGVAFWPVHWRVQPECPSRRAVSESACNVRLGVLCSSQRAGPRYPCRHQGE